MTYLHMLGGKKFHNLLRGSGDGRVFLRSMVKDACPELENNPITRGILGLIEDMTSEPRALTVDNVRARIEVLRKQSEGEQIHIIGQSDDHVTSRLKLISNKYLWNPALHSEFGENLYFFYLRGFMSITNVRATIATLLDPLLHGRYCLYELFGEHDILIRAWINGSLTNVTNIVRSIAATMSGRCRIHKVKHMRYTWAQSDEHKIVNARKSFIEAMQQYDGETLTNFLRSGKHIIAEIEDIKPPRVKAFTLVAAFSQRPDRDLFEEVNKVLDDSAGMLCCDRQISGLSTYGCYSEPEGASVLIKYHASNFHTIQMVPYLIHEKLADLRVRTDSLLSIESSTYQSDDGPFVSGYWMQKNR